MLLAQLSACFQSLPPLIPTSKLALLVLIPRWVGLCMFWGPVGLSSGLSCEAGIFSCHRNPHGFFQSEVLRLYFPVLESWVVLSVSLPSCYSWFTHTHMWDCLVLQPPSCHVSSLPQLPFSAPLTSLDECFLFNSLVVRVP